MTVIYDCPVCDIELQTGGWCPQCDRQVTPLPRPDCPECSMPLSDSTGEGYQEWPLDCEDCHLIFTVDLDRSRRYA